MIDKIARNLMTPNSSSTKQLILLLSFAILEIYEFTFLIFLTSSVNLQEEKVLSKSKIKQDRATDNMFERQIQS